MHDKLTGNNEDADSPEDYYGKVYRCLFTVTRCPNPTFLDSMSS